MSTTSSVDGICARISHRLADSVGAKRFNMWFERSAKFNFDSDQQRLEVTVPNRFVADWIGRNFEPQLRKAAGAEVGAPVQLQVSIRPDAFASTGRPAATPRLAVPPVTRPTHADRAASRQSLRHQLDDFIVGPSNELAFAAANRILEDEPGIGNPLFIHGGCGLGKTHLLQGVCQKMRRLHPEARVLYVTGEQFTNDFLDGIRSNKLAAFRRRIRKLDLLAVDDVRFIANKQATQQEFLHSFDSIELGGSRVVLASDCHPRLIKQFSEALVSRCIRGMVVEVKPPDAVTRVRLVRALAQRRRLALNDSVVELIAGRGHQSVRDIEGMLARIHALASVTQQRRGDGDAMVEVGHALVDHLFNAESMPMPRRALRFETILTTVCQELGMTREQVLGAGRHRHVVLVRSLVVHLVRQMTSMSFPEIAAAMQRGSHSTVITACQRVERQVAQNKPVLLPHLGEQVALRELIDRLKQAISRA